LALLLRHDREVRAARTLRLAGALILALVAVHPSQADPAKAMDPPPASASATELPIGRDETLLLEVIVNGYSTSQVGEFTLRSGKLYARPQELRDLDATA
jgi:hypothetical protein